jgi:hypothetical protein
VTWTPSSPQPRWHGPHRSFCFVLRAVNRILSDEDQPNTTINRLWDILDQPELDRALRRNSWHWSCKGVRLVILDRALREAVSPFYSFLTRTIISNFE